MKSLDTTKDTMLNHWIISGYLGRGRGHQTTCSFLSNFEYLEWF